MIRTRRSIQPPPRPRRRGFTLIELLVVISVIAILAALVTGAGVALVRRGAARGTEDVVRTLDRVLDEYLLANSGVPPKYKPEQYERVPGKSISSEDPDGPNENVTSNDTAFPSYNGARHPRWPDASVFLRQASGTGEADNLIRSLPDRHLVLTVGEGSNTSPTDTVASDTTPSVVDTWADQGWALPWPITRQSLILYVHPDNSLAQDLYGRCVNGRPYFVSGGPDRKYGLKSETTPRGGNEDADAHKSRVHALLEDNIYSYRPGEFRTDDVFFDTFR